LILIWFLLIFTVGKHHTLELSSSSALFNQQVQLYAL
jgi:hypothetical protein